MAIDPTRLDAFLADPGVPEEDKRAVAASLRSAPAESAPPATDIEPSASTSTTTTAPAPGIAGRALSGVEEATADLGASIEHGLRTVGEEASAVTEADPMRLLSGAAEAAGPFLYPPATLAQVGSQAAARAVGADPETARTTGALAGAATGIAGAVRGGIQGVQAYRAARAAAPGEAGAILQSALPKAAKASTGEIRASYYEPVADYAKTQGLGLAPGTPKADAAADAIEAAHAKWGVRDASQAVLDKLRAPGGAPVTYEDLDAALRQLPGKAKAAKGAVTEAIDSLLENTPAGAKLKAGRREYALARPLRRLAARVEAAESPTAAVRLLASASVPERAQIAERALGGDSADWQTVLDGLKALKPGHGAKLGERLQRHAIYPLVFGHPEGAMLQFVAGGGIKYAAQATKFLQGGLAGRPAASALARAISAWSEGQDEPTKAAGATIASALSEPSTGQTAAPIGRTPTQTPQSAATPQTSSRAPFDTEAQRVGSVVGVDPRLLHAVMHAESRHNPSAVSPGVGATGLMQLLPSTFEGLRPRVEALVGRRADIRNPWDNLAAGALYYKDLLDRFGGNVEQAARYYHGGEDVRQHGPKTLAYAHAVASAYRGM